ncbi:NHX7, partial [Symbiodinium microadriaticum]
MYVFPFSWSWTFCMVFGAVTSATDPVAVVSILKDSGASPNLTMIIIGESLLNDGTAMVLFGLFFGMLKGTTYSGGEVAIYFFKMVIGSPLVGIVCGLVGVYLLGRANRPLSSDDVTMQIAIALCTAYTVFVMGQETLGLSGVLTCYSAGLVFAWLSPALILQREAMHIVWGMVEWMANTLVFLLAGLIIGTETMHHIDLKNCGYLVLLYFTLMAIRFVVVFALFPFIRRAGQQSCTAREAVLISWSGLRGALSIALAMMVRSEVNDGDGAHPNELFFYVGGLAALTLLVNATSVAPLLSKLEILQREGSPHKSMIMLSITRNLRRHMRINLAELISKTPVADMAAVIDCNSLLSDAERE